MSADEPPVVPAATDEPALFVIGRAACHHTMHDDLGVLGDDDMATAERVVAALEANGYRIVKET